jgi:hypothetical protein
MTPGEIASWLTNLTQPGQLVEVRALGVGSAKSVHRHYLHDGEGAGLLALAQQGQQWDQQGAKGIYWTPNPLHPGLKKFASDGDVLERRWVLVDIDPVRPADVSSSGEEYNAAWEVCCKIRGAMEIEHWPAPLVACSGNGWHLLYPYHSPNDAQHKEKVKELLAGLDQRLSDQKAKIDRTTFNASRIVRLWGTTARKGENTPERPHRTSFVVEMPTSLDGWDHEGRLGVEALERTIGRWHRTSAMLQAEPEKRKEDSQQRQKQKAADELLRQCERLASAKPGDRNNLLNRAAYALAGYFPSGDLGFEHVAESLTIAARQCGLSDSEIEATLKQAMNKGARKPRASDAGDTPVAATAKAAPRKRLLDPFERFPVEVLPEAVRHLATVNADTLKCDPVMVALPAMCVLAGCIGNAYSVRLWHNWFEPSILWAAVVAESGSMKTPALNVSLKPLEEIQNEFFREYKHQMDMYRAAKMRGEEPEKPERARRCYVKDATIEALAEILERTPKGMLLVRDELDAWFRSFTRYTKGDSTDQPRWLELHTAGALSIDRKSGDKKEVHIPRAACSVVGTIQPGVLAAAFDEKAVSSGFAARFLVAMPPRVPRVPPEREPPEGGREFFKRLLLRLLNAEMADAEAGTPHVLRLTPEAERLWKEFVPRWNSEAFADPNEPVRSASAKLEAYAARLALVIEVTARASEGDLSECLPVLRWISPESMQAGITLARWFIGEAHRIYSLRGESEAERACRQLADWVRTRGGHVAARDLQLCARRSYRTAEEAAAKLDQLVKAGYGRWEKIETGGRPRTEFFLDDHIRDDTEVVPEVKPEDDSEEMLF